MSKGLEQVGSRYAMEGTAAHALAEHCLTTHSWPHEHLGREFVPGFPVTHEMAEAVDVYVEAIAEIISGNRVSMLVEHTFSLEQLRPGLFGTADVVLFYHDTKTLSVWDYKHGQGVAVEVKDNPQLMYYALGALVTTKFGAGHVELVVCQPRCAHPDGPIRKHTVPVIELLEFAADLVEYAKATEDPDAPLIPGEHCKWCNAAAVCPKLRSECMAHAVEEFSAPSVYDPTLLTEALDKIPMIESWIKSVRAFAQAEAQRGRTPPNYKLVAKRATRKFKNELEVVEALAERGFTPAEVYEPPTLKSVAQIEKLVGKKDADFLEDFIIKESSGVTLVRDDDRRSAVKADAASEFEAVN